MDRKNQEYHPQPRRHDRMVQERIHDPYRARLKMAGPAICPQCNAVYEQGRWHWGPRPTAAGGAAGGAAGEAAEEAVEEAVEEIVCPACRRIADRCPAGIVTLSGAYVGPHQDELLALVRHQHELETAEHPLNRIMDIRDTADGFEVTTTDIHLPRRIGEALRRTHHGDLTLHFDEGGYFARVHWQAD
ncbi:MAG TPA: BCAM0308 family protein [Arenibaculum sp.]|nr:BCAM0308 family protein [Arenibaculum sp.]